MLLIFNRICRTQPLMIIESRHRELQGELIDLALQSGHFGHDGIIFIQKFFVIFELARLFFGFGSNINGSFKEFHHLHANRNVNRNRICFSSVNPHLLEVFLNETTRRQRWSSQPQTAGCHSALIAGTSIFVNRNGSSVANLFGSSPVQTQRPQINQNKVSVRTTRH